MDDVRDGFECMMSNPLISMTGNPTCPIFLTLSPLFHFTFVVDYVIDWLIDSSEEQESQVRWGEGGVTPRASPAGPYPNSLRDAESFVGEPNTTTADCIGILQGTSRGEGPGTSQHEAPTISSSQMPRFP